MSAEDRLKVLMLDSLAGDRRAYRALLAETGEALRRYFARRLTAGAADVEDLVQDTLLAIHEKRATWDPARPFTPWLYAIARYRLIDRLRRRGGRVHVPLESAESLFAPDDHAAASAAGDLERLLEDLPEAQRDLLRQVKIEGLTSAEAGERAGLSEGAVKVRVHRSMKALAARVKDDDAQDR